MRLIDLSQPVYHDAPNCPAHPPVKSEILADHPQVGWRVELITMATHTGSHVDAPLHKLAGGRSIDAFPLESFVGDAYLVDLRDVSAPDRPVTRMDLQSRLPGNTALLRDRIVLLATGFGDRRAKSDEWLHHPAYLAADAAEWLVRHKVRGVGIDHYSVAGPREPNNAQVHTILLEAGVWILEELRFPPEAFKVRQPCRLWCLPVNFKGHSGSFCRPVLVVEDEVGRDDDDRGEAAADDADDDEGASDDATGQILGDDWHG